MLNYGGRAMRQLHLFLQVTMSQVQSGGLFPYSVLTHEVNAGQSSAIHATFCLCWIRTWRGSLPLWVGYEF